MVGLKPNDQIAWSIVDAFNEIVTNDEKKGGRPRQEFLMENFIKALAAGNLFDMG